GIAGLQLIEAGHARSTSVNLVGLLVATAALLVALLQGVRAVVRLTFAGLRSRLLESGPVLAGGQLRLGLALGLVAAGLAVRVRQTHVRAVLDERGAVGTLAHVVATALLGLAGASVAELRGLGLAEGRPELRATLTDAVRLDLVPHVLVRTLGAL